MKKSIIISIKPKWVEKILNGEKTIEIRKSIPKCELPIDVYIYCTKGKPFLMVGRNDNKTYLDNGGEKSVYSPNHNYIGNGKIVAKFTLNKVDKVLNNLFTFKIEGKETGYTHSIAKRSCLDFNDMHKYLYDKDGYALHIDNLQIFGKPMELSEFYKNGTCNLDDFIYNLYEGYNTYAGYLLGRRLKKAPLSWCYCYKERE